MYTFLINDCMNVCMYVNMSVYKYVWMYNVPTAAAVYINECFLWVHDLSRADVSTAISLSVFHISFQYYNSYAELELSLVM